MIPAAALADGSLPNATQFFPYAAQINAIGGSGGYTFTTNSSPAGLTLSSSGMLTGVPTSVGTWRFAVTATDSNHVSSTQNMSVDVVGTPARLPQITPYDGFLQDCSFGVPCSRGASVSSGGRAPFTWSQTGLPQGLSMRSGAGQTSYWVWPGDVQIAGVATQMGTFQVRLTVTDADGVQATNTFALTVRPLYLWSFMPNGLYGVPYSHAFYMVGGVGPYSVTQAGGQLPLGLAINSVSFNVTGTPQEHGSNFNPTLRFGTRAAIN